MNAQPKPTAAEVVTAALYADEPDLRPDSAVKFMEASRRARVAVEAIAAAGRLVTAEHDAQVAAGTFREAAERADSFGHHWSGAPALAFFGLAEDYRARADRIAAGGAS